MRTGGPREERRCRRRLSLCRAALRWSDPAFQFIEAMAASGITVGCSAAPPLYCPDNPVTRRQMAVFFSKALGLHWPQ